MKLSDKISCAAGLIKALGLNKKVPLIIGWALTYRCNSQCGYCGLNGKAGNELNISQIESVLNELKSLGTKIISFTGGEPLVRNDFGDIIKSALSKGFSVRVNSNGILVPEKIYQLTHINKLNLSLDGPCDVHDSIRGRGSFGMVLRAARCAFEQKIGLSFCCVISNKNYRYMRDIIQIARQYSAGVLFQISAKNTLGSRNLNDLAPSSEQVAQALNDIVSSNYENVLNSKPMLEYLKCWPNGKEINCLSAGLSARIEPNGDVLHCSRETFDFKPLNALTDGFKKAFESLPKAVCSECWCAGRLELNSILSFNTQAIKRALSGI